MARTAKTADRFALRLSDFGMLTGASMAVRAISDGVLILHTGVGCKYKGAAQQAKHDRALAPHHREGFTEVTDQALIRGSSRHIGPYVRNWYEKRRPGFMAVVPANFLEMAGEDIDSEVARASDSVPCPLELIRCPGDRGDMYEGYAEVVRRVLGRIPFKKTRPKPGRVAVAGFLFDRYEADTTSNISELRGLLHLLGLDMAPPLMSGRTFSALCGAADAEKIICLPYAGPAGEIARITGRPVVEAGLPMGLAGTFHWLRRIAAAFNRDTAQLETWIRGQTEAAGPRIDQFRNAVSSSLAHRRAAVFADTPLAAGLCGLLLETGIVPGLVGLRDETLGGENLLRKALGGLGLSLPEETDIAVNPALRAVHEMLLEMLAGDKLGLVAGSTCEMGLVERAAKEHIGRFHPELRLSAWESKPLQVEIGFPSDNHHVIADQPTFGVRGALNILQRIYSGFRF